MKWVNTGYLGIRYREHSTRKWGRRPDRYYVIRYRKNKGGKQIEEAVGWTSEGWTTTSVADLLAKIKQNNEIGEGPKTLEEMRTDSSRKKIAETQANAPAEVMFDEIAHRYIEWAKTNKPGSWKADQYRLRKHLLPQYSGRKLVNITKADIELLKETLLTNPRSPINHEPLAPATVMQCLTLIRSMFNYAANTPLFDNNPDIMIFEGYNPASMSKRYQRGIKPPKVNNQIQRVLTDTEVNMILNYAKIKHPDFHDVILCTLDQGYRRNEIASLCGYTVNQESWTVTILDSKGKTRQSYAGILYPTAQQILQERIQEFGVDLVFPGRGKAKRDLRHITRMFTDICDKTNINKGISDRRFRITFHGLRHKFATSLLERGMDIYSLMTIMGHNDINTTRRYLHLCNNGLRERAMQLKTTQTLSIQTP
ncbi:tyrosine-type recombinase/integrase [Maridesulfovibrio ferrireducens]|uniref:tyrosine-type recombinase/integrase n=1 Tax=Maridesulfovibrio ferrireducens TaxID=246191 RepID=UPI001A188B6B|nr:tyrosine-type recombinase/integrase [Maridesulfovibrio ferrireducens]MBI9111300.1 tyrosine-type recombinase/integrase [Maridesulfovibrio ferrireducens]